MISAVKWPDKAMPDHIIVLARMQRIEIRDAVNTE
jgi:hypothetical protein